MFDEMSHYWKAREHKRVVSGCSLPHCERPFRVEILCCMECGFEENERFADSSAVCEEVWVLVSDEQQKVGWQ